MVAGAPFRLPRGVPHYYLFIYYLLLSPRDRLLVPVEENVLTCCFVCHIVLYRLVCHTGATSSDSTTLLRWQRSEHLCMQDCGYS